MDIVIGDIPYVKKDPPEEKNRTPAGQKALRKERRKSKQDRRSSVRDGIFVSFSGMDDRRVLRDRRKVSS